MTETRITIPLPGATAWECGECRFRKKSLPGFGCLIWDVTLTGIGDFLLFQTERCPSCLFAETGIEGYRRGEFGSRCWECGRYQEDENLEIPSCHAWGKWVNPDGTCPRWEKG